MMYIGRGSLSNEIDEVYQKYREKCFCGDGRDNQQNEFFSQWLFDKIEYAYEEVYEGYDEILKKSSELVKFKELVKKCATNVILTDFNNNGTKFDNCSYDALPFKWVNSDIIDLKNLRFVMNMILYLYNKRLINLTGCGHKSDYKNIKNNNIYHNSIGICICSEYIVKNIILHSSKENYKPHGDIIEASLFNISMMNCEKEKLSLREIISLFYRFPKK